MNTKVEKTLARYIVMAQRASDAGKCIYELPTKSDPKYADRFGYAAKERYIVLALSILTSTRHAGSWRFYVVRTPDQNKYPSVLTYFEYGDRQICFHTPLSKAGNLLKYAGHGTYTEWDHGSSRDTANFLARKFGI